MDPLQKRKQELLLESELNRQILRLELDQLRLQVDRVRQHWLRNIWVWVAPVAGFIFARKLSRPAGFLAKGSAVLSLLTRLLDLWLASRSKTS